MATDAPPLDEQLRRLGEFTRYLPPDLRAMIHERYVMGYEEYGDAWAEGRNNVAEALPEVADALVYLFQAQECQQVDKLTAAGARCRLRAAWDAIKQAQEAGQ